MKTRSNGASPSLDTLASQIFARLDGEHRESSIDDLQHSLTIAANMLARPAADTEKNAHAALLELPAQQREALLLHLSGHTHVQVAQKQGRSADEVLKELARAYVRLRFSLSPPDKSGAQETSDAEPSEARDPSRQIQEI